MTSNRLKLNAEKTRFIWLGSSYYTSSVSRLPLSVGGSTVFPDDTVRNLGVTSDTQFTMRHHVDNVVCSCFLQLRQWRSLRRLLHTPSTRSSQVALTTVTLFCSVSLTASSNDCSQSCMLPRGWSPASDATSTSHRHYVTLFTRCRYHSASSPSKLRWWCSIVFVADLRSTLVMCTLLYTPLLHVRDCDQPTTVTSSSHRRFGCRSSHVCGPTIWNKLPLNLRSTDTGEQFKCSLKGLLFDCAYGKRRAW